MKQLEVRCIIIWLNNPKEIYMVFQAVDSAL